jgi:hypothetical protein
MQGMNQAMRTLLVLAATLLSLGASACGGASKGTNASSPSVATSATPTKSAARTSPVGIYSHVDSDKDNDVTAPYDDKNNDIALNYGHAASAADERAVTTLVHRYYIAAATGAGAKACSLILSGFSKAIAEDYGRGSAGPPYLRTATTCPAVMNLIFKHSHGELAAALPKLEVSHVRLVGRNGFAILRFGALEREIAVVREGSIWKIGALLDSELP